MNAWSWHGSGDLWIDNVDDPKTQHPRNAVVRITASGICGSDLHLFSGFMPTMKKGDITGHEPKDIGDEIDPFLTGLAKMSTPFTGWR